MLWFFSKGDARLRVLTSLDAATGEYIVELSWPDRAPEIRRFPTEDSCSAYLSHLERELERAQWIADGVRLADRKTVLH